MTKQSNAGICEHCFLFASQLDKHYYEEHGVRLSDEKEAELRTAALDENRKRLEEAKIPMTYIGDGPITSK